MILPFDYIGYKRLSENKRFPNHRWYSDATWGGNGWMSSIGPHAEVIYCRLVKYTQHTAGFTENNWAPRWSYLLSVGQAHTTHCRFYREQLGPPLKLSTVGWSSRHNNTLQVLQRTIGPHTEVIYCRLVKYTQQHTVGFTENNWVSHWSYLLSVGQVDITTHCSFTENNWAPHWSYLLSVGQ